MDWLVADMVALRGGSLGHLRYVMKDTLQLMPLYGHYFYAHGCIYVKRGNFNQGKMIASLDYLRNPNIPVGKSYGSSIFQGKCCSVIYNGFNEKLCQYKLFF